MEGRDENRALHTVSSTATPSPSLPFCFFSSSAIPLYTSLSDNIHNERTLGRGARYNKLNMAQRKEVS